MKSIALRCAHCGSANVRRARLNGFREALYSLVGRYPFRCRDCQHRFPVSVLLVSQLAYAKCPQCLRADLDTWSRKNYKPGLWENFRITFGGRQYRCPVCRCNFVSFRPRRKRALRTI